MITADKVKNQIQTLIETANEKTGNNDADLTSAVGSLVEGFGGGDELDAWRYATGCLFGYAVFPDGYDLEISMITGVSSFLYSFQYAQGIRSVKLISVDKTGLLKNANVFMQNQSKTKLEIIDFSEFITTFSVNTNLFSGCSKLVKILGDLDFSACTSNINTFSSCSSLVEVRFKENTIFKDITFAFSPLLSDTSIQSIIDGLADLTGGTAQTLTLHADVKAKLTEEQIATITSKNWTLA